MTKAPKKNKINDVDSELIAAINAGEKKRFTELVGRYQDKLYNFGLRLCRDIQDAEDLVQDTFINAFKSLKNFRYESQFKNWLYKVAAGVCYKKRRKSKFAPERELALEEFMASEAKQPDDMPAWAVQPIDKVLNDELAEHLNKAIAELPEKYRLVLVLRDLEGFSTDETADILNVSEANVKVRLHRARLFLREALRNYYDHEPA